MGFKAVDEIPHGKMAQYKTIRQRIREDIAEAEKQGVYKFEFVGDYNFKTLMNTAREEADRMNRQAVVDFGRKAKAANPEYDGVYFNAYDRSLSKKYKITSVKTDEEGVRRVFCEIDPDGIEKGWQQAVKDYEKRQAKPKREKLKLEYPEEGE